MLTIEGRSVGSRKPLFDDFSVSIPFDPGDGGLTLRELIARIVRAETAAFRKRREARRLDRVMTRSQINERTLRGKISPEGLAERERLNPSKVDDDDAVAVACQAFEDGLYLVVLDGEEQRHLDQPVYLRPDSRVTFVRLVFLSGA